MRPASEIHSALDLVQASLSRHVDRVDDATMTEREAIDMLNLTLTRDLLEWVVGQHVEIDGPNAWLCGYLLDDPPKLDDTRPDIN